MAEELDPVARYAMSLGFGVRPRTVIVEGTTDVELFQLASRLERDATGVELLGNDLAIIAAGVQDLGGTRGVIRELVVMRGLARTLLLPNGRPIYRFIALFDDDKAGKQAVRAARDFDTSLLECKDMFRLCPVMPLPGNLDPGTMQKAFERENAPYKGIEWEAEDLLAHDFYEPFCRSTLEYSKKARHLEERFIEISRRMEKRTCIGMSSKMQFARILPE